jgi:uncharacterized membrane protein YcgQ (UPF0703/DUF1980 family)
MIYAGQVFIQSSKFHPNLRSQYTEEELESEERWAASFASSQDALAKLAERARKNYLAGNTEILDPDNL